MIFDKIRRRYVPMSETMFYILFSLREERHGYGIMQHVNELTAGRIVLGAGTVYSSISKLERDGLIEPVKEENRRKTYLITETGTRILREEAARIAELYQHAEVLL
ncbi:MAG: PadR family transcriptional regulator [Bacillota bacterium]|nr:PadR family transcriptional regulator [Candidatus Fermentithermobacillaceae bacterium]